MFTTLGSPVMAFTEAFRAVLVADTPSAMTTSGTTALMGLVTGVYGHPSEATRVAYPYLVLGRRSRNNDSGAAQVSGGHVSLDLDGWSAAKSPYEMQRVLSRVAALMERRQLSIDGWVLVEGSLTCEFEDVFDEPDEDMPARRLYHGVQRWVCEIHGA